MTEGAIGKLAHRAVRALEARIRYQPSPHLQRVLLLIAGATFLLGAGLAVQAIDLDWADLNWLPLILSAAIGVPLMALSGTLEYRLMARIVGARVGVVEALRISVLASAANLLPLPGSVMVRVQALTGTGSSLGRSTAVTGILGVTWVAVASAMAGAVLASSGAILLGGGFMAGGGILGSTLFLLRYVSGPEAWSRHVLAMVAVEALTVSVGALRIWLVLLGLNESVGWSAPFVFPIAGALAAAVGFFPGGMGLRELLTAALSPLVGLPPSVGFLVSSVNRVLAALGFAPVVALLLFRLKGRSERDGVSPS